jgi:hypothetical protein
LVSPTFGSSLRREIYKLKGAFNFVELLTSRILSLQEYDKENGFGLKKANSSKKTPYRS